ncbi:ferric uptake regulation protein [Leptospira ryugenii]|uniref:Ferric uptake regulation protein n=1 Tax=Leptospira ryugenii TaxID=1917863 RepID=A0A2P2DZ36_9LEPT|nr:Fur family transcriptional regulator [Leptospira ryugenii]GBF49894.1 ferric uptake regulation protein [Leptospira ryugenii]
MEANYQKTKEILESYGIRATSQRLEMAHLLLSAHKHFTAEEIFHLINSHFPHASRATIFNNLKLFSEKGVIGTLELKNGVTLYDSNMERHHHAVEEGTGRIIDVYLDEETESKVHALMKEELEKSTGKSWKNTRIMITLKGES